LARLAKPDHSVSYSRLSSFGSFQNMNRTGAKLEDSKIQGVLKQGKEPKGIKELKWKEIKQGCKVVKIGLSGFGF
jgi:hypothetical protein